MRYGTFANRSSIALIMPYDTKLIDGRFVKPTYREGQRRAIEFALETWNSGKRFVVLEAPVGSGKTAIGMTLARFMRDSYYLTATKQLQDQLIGEFGDEIVEVKGKNAYPCTYWERWGEIDVKRGSLASHMLADMRERSPTCQEGYCRSVDQKGCPRCFPKTNKHAPGVLDSLPTGMSYSACPYYEQIFQAINSDKVAMNFSSFLYQTQFTKRFSKRELLIADEAHQLEAQLLDFVSLSLNDIRLQDYGIRIPPFQKPAEYALWFDRCKIEDKLREIIAEARDSLQDFKLEDEYLKILQKYRAFMQALSTDDQEWVAEYSEHKHGKHSHRTVDLKPVFVSSYSEQLFFGAADHILLMSGTILDVEVYCRNLGIQKNELASMRLKNRFPTNRRPIYIRAAAKATGGPKAMGEWGPKLVKAVNQIVTANADRRGIIHTHNFAIAELFLEKCKRSVRERFLFQKDFRDKSEMLAKHANATDTVIVAPAMHEGLDLHGDLARFAIIAKTPYANFFDNKQLARRVELDRRFYTWLTAIKLIQSTGRAVRSEDDWAITYIIDSGITKFLSDAHKILPDWWTEAIIHDNGPEPITEIVEPVTAVVATAQ